MKRTIGFAVVALVAAGCSSGQPPADRYSSNDTTTVFTQAPAPSGFMGPTGYTGPAGPPVRKVPPVRWVLRAVSRWVPPAQPDLLARWARKAWSAQRVFRSRRNRCTRNDRCGLVPPGHKAPPDRSVRRGLASSVRLVRLVLPVPPARTGLCRNDRRPRRRIGRSFGYRSAIRAPSANKAAMAKPDHPAWSPPASPARLAMPALLVRKAQPVRPAHKARLVTVRSVDGLSGLQLPVRSRRDRARGCEYRSRDRGLYGAESLAPVSRSTVRSMAAMSAARI